MKGIIVLGSTGSVGTQTLDVVRSFPDDFNIVGLAARSNLELLADQVQEFRPKFVFCETPYGEQGLVLPNGSQACEMDEMVRAPEVELVVTATVGNVALVPTLSAIKAGKNIALANKESIIVAGTLLTDMAREYGVDLLPVDSEPNAIWQCLNGEEKSIEKLIITASGGAFRDLEPEALADVTPAQALNHPTWKMGPKITVDCATLMNKAFEVIEANALFGVPWENIEVVVHRQSIVHSMVEFVDGSVKAHMSSPDMRLPIQYALFHPNRVRNESIKRIDLASVSPLTFEPMRPDRYPCFQFALEVAKRGGTWPAALCGADEAAVDMFLSGRIKFLEIVEVIRDSLDGHKPIAKPSLDQLISASAWARDRVNSLVGA